MLEDADAIDPRESLLNGSAPADPLRARGVFAILSNPIALCPARPSLLHPAIANSSPGYFQYLTCALSSRTLS